MLKGIDISSHQGDINLAPLAIDFVIIKATEGTGYVNPYCEPKVQQAKDLGLLWGFYHFAGTKGAVEEATYFINNCSEWVNTFVRTVHEQTGIWPWIYANPWRFNQGGVEPNCARWVAQYPNVIRPTLDYDPGEPPATDGLVACWQYASDGNVPGYDGNLDVNHFFGDQAAWKKYAGDVYIGEQLSILENMEYKVTIERK